MRESIAKLFQSKPTVQEVIARRIPGLHFPVGYELRFTNVDRALVISAVEDDDTVDVTLSGGFDPADGSNPPDEVLTRLLRGKVLRGAAFITNLQGYRDAFEVSTTPSTVIDLDSAVVARFEVGASMILVRFARFEDVDQFKG